MKIAVFSSRKLSNAEKDKLLNKLDAYIFLTEIDNEKSPVELYKKMINDIDSSNAVYIYNPTSNHTNNQAIHPLVFAAIMYAVSKNQKCTNDAIKIYFHEYLFPSIIGYDVISQLMKDNLVEVHK